MILAFNKTSIFKLHDFEYLKFILLLQLYTMELFNSFILVENTNKTNVANFSLMILEEGIKIKRRIKSMFKFLN